MRTLLSTVLFVFMFGMFKPIQGQVFSSQETVDTFLKCFVDQIMPYLFSEFGDRRYADEVHNLMTNARREMEYGPRRLMDFRTFVISFVTSVAKIIGFEDFQMRRNIARENAYVGALQRCSISPTGYADPDFMREALKPVLDHNKTPVYDGAPEFGVGRKFVSGQTFKSQQNSNFDRRGFNPEVIQPVQENIARDFVTNGKASFEPARISFVTSSSSKESELNSGFKYPRLHTINADSFPNPEMARIPFDRKQSSVTDFSSVAPNDRTEESFGPISKPYTDVLNVPQTKESSIISIPGVENLPIPENAAAQNIPLPIRDEMPSQYSRDANFGFSENLRSTPRLLEIPPSIKYPSPLIPPFQQESVLKEPETQYRSEGVVNPFSFQQNSNLDRQRNQAVVQPSPVQNNFAPDFVVTNDKESFEPARKSSATFSSSEESDPSFGLGYPRPYTINVDSPSNLEMAGGPFDENQSSVAAFTSAVSDDGIKGSITPIPKLYPMFVALNVPQTTERSFIPILAAENPQIPAQSIPLSIKDETIYQYSSDVNSDLSEKLSPLPPSLAIPLSKETPSPLISPFEHESVLKELETEYRSEGDVIPSLTQNTLSIAPTEAMLVLPFQNSSVQITKNPSLDSLSIESIISDILINSTSFRNAFSSDQNPEEAMNIALTITEQALNGYDADMVEQALNAVANEISTVAFRSPENYAMVISKALGTFLTLHNIPLFLDFPGAASSMITTLNSQEQYYTTYDHFSGEIQDDSLKVEAPPIEQQQILPIDFQSSMLMPEDVQGEIFSNSLNQRLIGSFTMANFFCGREFATDAIMNSNLIKFTLSEYGSQISSIAASLISRKLAELNAESLCSDYPRIISNGIAKILSENGLIENANLEDIIKQMELSVAKLNLTLSSQSMQTALNSNSYGTTIYMETVIDEVMPTNPTLFTNSYSVTEQTPFEGPTTENLPSSLVPTNNVQSTELIDYNNITAVTEPMSTQIIDEELPPTEEPQDDLHEYTFGVEDAVEAFLMEEIGSVIESMEQNHNKTQNTTKLDEFLSETIINLPQGQYTDEPTEYSDQKTAEIMSSNAPKKNLDSTSKSKSQPKRPKCTRKVHKNKHKRRKQTTEQPNLRTDSGVKSSRNETHISDVEKEISSEIEKFHQSELESFLKEENQSSSMPSNVKENPSAVELQPSFRGPPRDIKMPLRRMVTPSSYYARYDYSTHRTARALAQITTSSIRYIRSSENFNLVELCGIVDELAAVVNIPPLDNCKEIPMIDYLLHALRSATKILSD